MKKPLVSIIMNCFNSEEFLKEAIDSVYAQGYDNWEIIFWDNASTDSSPDIAQSYDQRLRYFRGEQTIPLGAARNKALEQARGEYIAFLDCDDVWLEDKLEKQVAYFESHPECGFLYSNAYVIKDGKRELAYSLKSVMPEGRVFGRFLVRYPVNLQTVMLKKDLLDRLDMWFDTTLEIGEEYDFFLRLLYHAQAGYLSDPLVAYRLHEGMGTAKKFDAIIDERNHILNKLFSFIPDFEKTYAREIQLFQANGAVVESIEHVLQGRRTRARQVLKPYLSLHPKYIFLYMMTILPRFFYVMVHEAKGGIIVRQRARYLDQQKYQTEDGSVKVGFVYSFSDAQSISKPIRAWNLIQFGLSYMSSFLKQQGYDTRLLVLGSNQSRRSNERLIKDFVTEFRPDIMCFSAVVSEYNFIRAVASFIKEQFPEIFLVVGGAHVMLNPSEEMLDVFDALCIGEGEYPLSELCAQLGTGRVSGGIANLWIKFSDGRVEKNSTREFIQDLDQFPFPDRDMWKPWIKEQVGAEMAILLGRGCPYDCTYCCNHAIKRIASGKYVRMRSPQNIIEEVEAVYKSFPGQRHIYFEVETIALDKEWLKELCLKLKEFNNTIGKTISYGCNFRITSQSVDESVFASLHEANFYKVNIGLESGSERVRRKILKRHYSNQDVLDAVSMARKYGLKVFMFNMIGLPGETYQEHLETVALNRKCQPDAHYTGIFFPYPGTELYKHCVEKGLIGNAIDPQMERKQAFIDSPEFTRAQIRRAHFLFNYRVYRGYRPLWWIVLQMVMVKVRFYPWANKIFRGIVQAPIVRHLRAKISGT